MSTYNDMSGEAKNVIQARSIGNVTMYLPLPAQPPGPVPRQLPPASAAFVNQSAALADLDAALTGGARLFAVTGMAGVGKSSLAVRWLHQHAERFPDGHLYARLHGSTHGPTAPPGEVAAAFLRALGIAPARVPHAASERFALLRTELALRRLAILLDSVRADAQVIPLLHAAPDCVTVVTTTGDAAEMIMRGACVVALGTWSPQGSYALLESFLGPDRLEGQYEDAATLAELCAHHPLALAIAATRLATRPRWSLERLIRDLSDESRRLSNLAIDGSPAVSAVLDDAYYALNPEAAAVYRALGRMPVQAATPALTAAMLEIPLPDAERLLEQLVSVHLAEETEGRRYRQHDLVRAHARWLLDEPAAARRELHGLATYLITGLESAEKILTPSHHQRVPTPDAGTLPDELYEQFAEEAAALAWCDAFKDDVVSAVHACAERQMHREVFELVHLNWPIFLRFNTARLDLQNRALEAARALEEPANVAMIQTGRAASLRGPGRYQESIEAASEARDIYERLGELRGQAQATNTIGKTLRAMGDLDGAWQMHETAKCWRAMIGYTRGVGLSSHDMAEIAFDRAEYPTALALFEEAAHLLLTVLPEEGEAPDLYDGSLALIGAARAHGRLGNTEGAVALLTQAEQSMAERGSLRGRGFAAETLGGVLEDAGELDGAAEAYRCALRYFADTDEFGIRRAAERLAAVSEAQT